ncbi:TonB-linked outer membrane protein, SusC/RagA family [Belliella baltica DSM 15883]|uniref:TonB-linked outer membrane protein, SusC/RagA family n=2 Tax=Belliella TaxID=232244 RepID=I3Z985_BELBD|nr:TonB-linked outer membrane protein, SusC/RagA family [Belliella baltica DSM 15883]
MLFVRRKAVLAIGFLYFSSLGIARASNTVHVHTPLNLEPKSLIEAVFDLTLRGKVIDEEGVGIPGATVLLKGSSIGVATDIDGNYSLTVPDGNESGTIVFSFIGYTTKEIPIQNRTEINITLEMDTKSMEEVVVIGYGTQQKKDLTGAVAVVNRDELQKRQATTVGEALQGLATGVNVRGGGRPGSEANVVIRGLNNFSNASPLYVIDGMITTANRDFNPNDIESIQILKDASAAAIYGSRAANGVIIITTKRGKDGPMNVELSSSNSIQMLPRFDLAETDEFIRLNNMAYDNAGLPRQNLDPTINTDWQDAAFLNGSMNDFNATISGGGQSGSYLISGNYFGNKGAVIGTGFDRYSLRVNTQGNKGIFSIGQNLAISHSSTDEIAGNPIADVTRMLPTIPVYDENNPGGFGYGSPARGNTFGSNPVATANLQDRQNRNLRIRGNLWSEVKIHPSLTYRLNLGLDTSHDNFRFLRKEGNWTQNQPYDPAIYEENRAEYFDGLVENTLAFDRTFGNHTFKALAGHTYQHIQYSQIWGNKRNIPRNSLGDYYTVLDQGDTPALGGFRQEAALLSYLGRIEYSYADKYLINAVIRRDGTSRLSRDNRWGTFPSISGAWRISEEGFYSSEIVEDLKIRASYGKLGSSNIGYWDYLNLVNIFPTIAMGMDQNIIPGATQVRLANQNLRWEILTQQNYGVDAGFFRNKLTVSAEYFISVTEDVLTNMPIPRTTGNDGVDPFVNAASLRNKGFEFTATFREAAKPLNYYVTANLTTLNNEVLSLGYGRNDIYSGNTVTEIGQPIGMWFVLETDGIFQSAEEVQNHTNSQGQVIQPNAQPGDIRFKDNNDDGQITNEDKAVVGSPWPNYELGLNMGASYKGFDFSMQWFGSFGATVYNGYRSLVDRFDDNSNYRRGVQPWTPENPTNDFPRVIAASTLNSRGDTDRWLEDGSFFRLKLIRLGYNVPVSIVEKIGFSNAQVSISGQNLITFTRYTGLDPEFQNNNIFQRGVDNYAFPNLKMYTVGLQLGF